jgi:putative transposase
LKRTLCIKIHPTRQQEEALFALRAEFSKGCNQIAKIGLEENCFNRVKLHHLSYYQVRKECALASQMVCNGIRAVTGAYKSRNKKKDLPLIEFKEKSIHFDKRTYSFKNDKISLYTLGRRILVPMVLGERQKQMLLKGSFIEAELVFTRGKWFFNLVVEIPNVAPSLKNGVMGG